MTTYYFDCDGILADFHTDYVHAERERFVTYDYIRNLRPFAENVAIVRNATKRANCYIITRVANEDCARARREWIAEYLPEISADHVIILVDISTKYNFIREPGTLYDDNKSCANMWRKKTGNPAIWIEHHGDRIEL